MAEFVSPPADAKSPDHSTCRNCGQPIMWADYCYVHDSTGFADCWLTISGGRPIEVHLLLSAATGEQVEQAVEWSHDPSGLIVDPTLTVTPPEGKGKTMAEPVEWGPREEA